MSQHPPGTTKLECGCIVLTGRCICYAGSSSNLVYICFYKTRGRRKGGNQCNTYSHLADLSSSFLQGQNSAMLMSVFRMHSEKVKFSRL